VDPDGKKIIGVTKNDAKKARLHFLKIFSGKKFARFRNLITLKGRKFNKIDEASLKEAFEGVDLNEREKALVNVFVKIVNSKSRHLIQYMKATDNVIPFMAQRMLSNELSKYEINVEATVKVYGGIPTFSIISLFGGGVTTQTSHGSYSLKLEHAIPPTDYFYTNNNQEVINLPFGAEVYGTGHEIFGHAFLLGLGIKDKKVHHENAIRMKNSIIQVMGYDIYRSGSTHGLRYNVPNPMALPNYR
jgi:hypothetical protein